MGWADFITILFMDGIRKLNRISTAAMCMILMPWLVSLVFLLVGAIRILFLLATLIVSLFPAPKSFNTFTSAIFWWRRSTAVTKLPTTFSPTSSVTMSAPEAPSKIRQSWPAKETPVPWQTTSVLTNRHKNKVRLSSLSAGATEPIPHPMGPLYD